MKPTEPYNAKRSRILPIVAFTPKGGCPLKPEALTKNPSFWDRVGSIHPQGWVPVETGITMSERVVVGQVACSIHPQGWVPVETSRATSRTPYKMSVAFTPKGGCPLKPTPTRTV